MRNIGKVLAVMCFAALALSASASEHFAFRGGKVFRINDGNEVAVTAEVRLNNGARLLPDGFIVYTDGRRERFREDRWLTLGGEYIVIADASPAFDGYWFEDGHVYVIRESRPVIVTTEVVLRDGSRLQPDGAIVFRDGRRDRLAVGFGITLEGKRVEHKHHARGGDGRETRNAVDTREKPIDTSRKIENNTTAPATREAEAKAKANENAAKATEQRQENAAKAAEQRQENAGKAAEQRQENAANRQEKREENQAKREENAANRQEKRDENAAKREEKREEKK